MNVTINLGQIIGVVVGALVIQAVMLVGAFVAFKAVATEWHRQNQDRLSKIEASLGMTRPDDVSFLRTSEARTLIEESDVHAAAIAALRERLGVVEGTVANHAELIDDMDSRLRRRS